MSVQHCATTSLDFLIQYRSGGHWVLTAIAPDKRQIITKTFHCDQQQTLVEWLDHCAAQQLNVYFHVNPTLGRLDKKAEKGDVAALEWLHVDVDPSPGHDFEMEQARILKMMQENAALPAPTLIIFSGGGYQAFWKLSEPIDINGDISKAEDAERYNLQIELMLRGDSCHNIDRIMRLPGTVNWPNEKKRKRGQVPVMAQVVSFQPTLSYGLDKFTQAPKRQDAVSTGSQVPVEVSGNVRRIADLDEELPNAVSSRCKVAIVQGFDPDQRLTGDNSRSEWLFFVCCELVRSDVDDETIYSIITDPDFQISESVLDKGNSASIHRYAVRQIQRAKEYEVDPWLEQLNREYAVIESVGGRLRVAREFWDPTKDRQEIEFLLPDGFKQMWNNHFIEQVVSTPDGGTKIRKDPVGKWWFAHPNRRTYRTVVFCPNRNFDGVMNLWRGFACDAIPGDCQMFLDHLRNVLCKGNDDYYDYLIRWMANAVQNPHLPGQVAVVLKGDQGTGKGTFARIFGHLFGAHYKYVSDPRHVIGTFNYMLNDAVLVFADECFVSGSKQHESALKALITENTLRVEQKGVDSVDARNCVHLIMATNKEWAIGAELSDRRFFVLDVDRARRVDIEYFARMQEQMENGGYQALLHMLMTLDLSDFDVRLCPKTEELRNQQDYSLDSMQGFVLELLTEGRLMPGHGSWRQEVMKNELTDSFKNTYGWDSRGNLKMGLGKFLRKIGAESRRRYGAQWAWETATGSKKVERNPWVWSFPPLEECRRLWKDNFGERDWPEVADDPHDDYENEAF